MSLRTSASVIVQCGLAVMLSAPLGLRGQATAAPGQHASVETSDDLANRLTAAQRQTFNNAVKAVAAAQYREAFGLFQELLAEMPGDATLTKFAADAALSLNDNSFVLKNLAPLAERDPDDWQTASMLTRACAQSGDKHGRDAGIVKMLDLHRRGLTPAGLQRYVVEELTIADHVVVIWTSLEPWGPYHVYDLGQVHDRTGNIFLRTTVESNDIDQALFARDHPDEAKAGRRSYSLDAYRSTGRNSSGQQTQTHETYGFFSSQPTYEMVRRAFLDIVAGRAKPISSRSGLIVP